MRADLHSHSNNSDGVLSVADLVLRAKKHGVNILGLTDHDSVFGVDEAFEFGKKNNIYVLKGLELSTIYNNENCHLVCYFKKNEVPKKMYEFSNKIIQNRKNRAIEMMNKIKEIYHVKIDLNKLLDAKIITRGNMAHNLKECNNNLSNEEVSKLVDSSSLAYIPSTKMTAKEGIEFMRQFDCIIILAHPCLMKYENVEEIAHLGIDGIEALYPKNKIGDEEKFRNLAKENNLFISAGSDYHGDFKHAEIGTCYLEDKDIKNILNRLNIKEVL